MERAADGSHRAVGIAVSLARCPCIKLAGEVWGGVPGKRRIAGVPRAIGTVATGAGRNAALRFAHMIELRAGAVLRSLACGRRRRGQSRVISDHLLPRLVAEAADDPLHLRMPPRARGIKFELTGGISSIKAGKARSKVAVAQAAGAVAGGAGGGGAGLSAAERDHFTRRLERVGGRPGRAAAARQTGDQNRQQEAGSKRHAISQAAGSRRGSVASALMLAVSLAGCKAPPDTRHASDAAAVERGKALIVASGCASCHAFPDVDWPRGRTGPSLTDYDGLGPIAGSLPNTPANLAAFVRNAPAAKPGSTMPAMPLSAAESRDVAAYLYGLADD